MQRTAVLALLVVSACNHDRLATRPQPEEPPVCGDAASCLPQGEEPEPELPPFEPVDDCMFYGNDDDGTLWRIDPTDGTAEAVGSTGVTGLTDLAIHADGRLIAIDLTTVYQLDPDSGTLVPLWPDLFDRDWFEVGAEALVGNDLLVGGIRSMAVVDLETGDITSIGTVLPNGSKFSGDFADIDGTRVWATVSPDSGNDKLYLIDLEAKTAESYGSLGHKRVFGLDYGCDGELYALVDTDLPRLLHLVPDEDDGSVSVTDLGELDGPQSLLGAAGPAH